MIETLTDSMSDAMTHSTTISMTDSIYHCFSKFKEQISELSVSRSGQLEDQLIFLLHHISVSGIKIEDVPSIVIQDWLKVTEGLSEHNLRLEMVEYLSRIYKNSAFRDSYPRSSKIVAVRDVLFWRRHHKEVYKRTRSFFNNITQNEIIDYELDSSTTFHPGLRKYWPGLGSGGVYSDSDEEIVRELRQLGMNESVRNVVDLGCGGGRLLKRLGIECPEATLTGTSIFHFSPDELKNLSEANITPCYCTAHKVELANNSQDIVVSSEVIEHLRYPEEMVREIARILKPGGIYCVTAPSINANMYCKNPLSYLTVAIGTLFPKILPPFHDLYAPMTPLKLVHYGFERQVFKSMFLKHSLQVNVKTTRFTALKKFGLGQLAARLPVFKNMGGLCMAVGRK